MSIFFCEKDRNDDSIESVARRRYGA